MIAFAILLAAIHVAVIVRAILLEGREPLARTAWLLLLIGLPGIGTILYLFFGEPWISTAFRERARRAYKELLPFAPDHAGAPNDPTAAANAFRTCEATSHWLLATGNTASVATDSDGAIETIVADIDAARQTVHLSFYIWLNDHNGTKVVEAICRAARRGVKCRIVADAVGSRAMVRSHDWMRMREAGAKLCVSLKAPLGLGFLVGHRVDLRNHRKIVVVDGWITWCGSQNCADPAFLPKRKFAPWVDILIRYEGPVARQAELIFAAAWTTETGEDLREALSMGAPQPREGGFPALAVGTGPLSPRGTMTDIFVAVLASAQESVTITTPYFAPDPPLLAAIVAAARRGVEIRIVFPRRNDSRIVGAIGRAYYPTLAAAGVRIFEFRGGLLHAKTLVVDGSLGLVGSANMDRRSLDLNFENNVLFASLELAGQVGEHQRKWMASSNEIDHDDIAARSMPRRFVDNILTMVAAVF